jgi:hypothetical protein
VRHEQPKETSKVRFSELWGNRSSKYARLLDTLCESTEWQTLQPGDPLALFTPQDDALAEEYLRGTSVTEMFGEYTTAIQTARDSLVTAFSVEELNAKVGAFADATIPDETLRERYGVADGRGWTVREARRMLRDAGIRPELAMQYSYRPYDQRVIYYSPIVVAWPRTQIAQHVAGRSNLVLLCTRNSNNPAAGVALVSRGLADKRVLAGSRGEAKFMYLYKRPPRIDAQTEASEVTKPETEVVNLTPAFLQSLVEATGLDFASQGLGDDQGTIRPGRRYLLRLRSPLITVVP